MLEVIAQGGPDGTPSWFSGIVAGGVCAILLAFIVWRLFGHLIPQFLKTLESEREAFRASLEKARSDFWTWNQADRAENKAALTVERTLHHEDMDKISKAMGEQNRLLHEQNALLARLLDKIPRHTVVDATVKQVDG